MKNILFLDFETGGFDPKRHAPLQFAYIIEHDGEIVKEECYDLVPDRNADLCLAALEVNNFTLERMKAGKDFSYVLLQLKLACIPYNGIFPVGHNVQFDLDFLKAGADSAHENIFAYLDIKRCLDTRAIAQWLAYRGRFTDRISDFKLTTLCAMYGIDIDAHDALGDVRATRKLFHVLELL